MRIIRSSAAALLVTLVAAVGVSFVASALTDGAAALEQPVMLVSLDKDTIATYGPLAVPNPTNQVADPVPEDCRTGVIGLCDVIPVKVIYPIGYDPTIDYARTTITVAWDDAVPSDVTAAGGVSPNDIDVYIYDAKDEPIAAAATAGNPEVARTEQSVFYVVVNNFGLSQAEYSIKLHLDIDRIEKPFELPAPLPPPSGGFGLPTGSPVIDAGPGSGDFDVPPADAPAAPATTTGGALTKIDLVPAAGNSIEIDFEKAQQELAAKAGEFKTTAASKKANGAGVWFWLVLLPLAVIASGGVWLVRRSPTALKH